MRSPLRGELCLNALRELDVLGLNLEVVGALCFGLDLSGHTHILVTLVRRCPDVDQCTLRRRMRLLQPALDHLQYFSSLLLIKRRHG